MAGRAASLTAEDLALIDDLKEFEVVVDPKRIAKNREIFLKQLNHLKARQKMEEKSSPGRATGSSPGRSVGSSPGRSVGSGGGRLPGRPSRPAPASTNSSDDEDDEQEEVQVRLRSVRRRTIQGAPVPSPPAESSRPSGAVASRSPSRKSLGGVGVPVAAGPILKTSNGHAVMSDVAKPVSAHRGGSSAQKPSGAARKPKLGEFSSDDDDDRMKVSTSNKADVVDSGIRVNPALPPRGSTDPPSSKVSSPTSGSGGSRGLFSSGMVQNLFRRHPADTSSPTSYSSSSSTSSRGRDYDQVASRFGQPPAFTTRPPVSSVGVTRRASIGAMGWVGLVGAGHHVISRCLFAIPVVLFVVITAMYLNLQFSSTGPDQSIELKILECSSTKGQSDEGCVASSDVGRLKMTVRELLNELSRRAGSFDCGYEPMPASRSMSVGEVKEFFKKKDLEYHDESFQNVLTALHRTPALQIKLTDNSGEEVTDKKDLGSLAHLESARAAKGLVCRVRLAINKVFTQLIIFLLIVMMIVVVALLVWFYIKKKSAETRDLHHLVEDIIGVLKNHAASNRHKPDQLHVPIPHVRDSLIPLQDRKRKQALWNRAVRFLSANESRVREEVHFVDGEQTSCWKWIELYSDPLVTSGREPAVCVSGSNGSSTARVESRPSSTCLKVYNILANGQYTYSNLPPVRDAILDRCGTYHGVLHMAVDPTMQDCLFVKCVSEAAAGQNYRALHGWSYNGKIVSVQYMGDGLYKTLFPDSTEAMVPLRSSLSSSRRSASFLPASSSAATSG